MGKFCLSVLRACTARESAQTLLLIEFLKAGLPLLPADETAAVCEALLRLALLSVVRHCVAWRQGRHGGGQLWRVCLTAVSRLSHGCGCWLFLQPRVTSLALSVITHLLKSPIARLKRNLLRNLVTGGFWLGQEECCGDAAAAALLL